MIKVLISPSRFIPAPTRNDSSDDEDQPASRQVATLASFEPPPYGHRKNFIPRLERDFGDGGAFPEIVIVQYPLVCYVLWEMFFFSRVIVKYKLNILDFYISIFINREWARRPTRSPTLWRSKWTRRAT